MVATSLSPIAALDLSPDELSTEAQIAAIGRALNDATARGDHQAVADLTDRLRTAIGLRSTRVVRLLERRLGLM